MGGIGQLHGQTTIGTLPDDVLLQIFKLFVDATCSHFFASEEWRTLVHVCQRWRHLAFASPRYLNLQLRYNLPHRSLEGMLNIWPEIPIFLDSIDGASEETIDDIAAALRLNHRVSGIRLESIPRSEWETILPLMQHPFPFLTYLWIHPRYPNNPIDNAITRSFLGGSATCLRDLSIVGVSFPALPELLLSTTNLVHLVYITPPSGYISPQAMVIGLSALTRLESLSLVFRSSQDRPIRITPPHTRTLLPALTDLYFVGVPEYMEDLIAQIDARSLESMMIELLRPEVFEVSELAKFVRRAEKLSLADRAQATFGTDCVSITLTPKSLGKSFDPKTFIFEPKTSGSHLRLSNLARFCTSCLPTSSPFETLYIFSPYDDSWHGTTDDSDPQRWLELLRPFTNVKDLHLSRDVARHVAQALRGLPVERVTEVLPALGSVVISGRPWPFGPTKEAISEFAAARQLSGHPVSILQD